MSECVSDLFDAVLDTYCTAEISTSRSDTTHAAAREGFGPVHMGLTEECKVDFADGFSHGSFTHAVRCCSALPHRGEDKTELELTGL